MNSVLKIKNYLKNNNIEACLISKNNTFLNEFVEDRDNFLLKITKFTGSLGYAIIYKNKQNFFDKFNYKNLHFFKSNKNLKKKKNSFTFQKITADKMLLKN